MLKKIGITAIAVSTLALTGCQSEFEEKFQLVLADAKYRNGNSVFTSEQTECIAEKSDEIFPKEQQAELLRAFNQDGASDETMDNYYRNIDKADKRQLRENMERVAKSCGWVEK